LIGKISNPKVLIVDDEAANIEIIRQILEDSEDYEYIFYEASDGTQALKKVEKIMPDIVLLDVKMPGENGFEVAKKIKSGGKTRFIPIIMVTALSEQGDRIKGLEAGVDDFVTKPVNVIELRARVKNLIKLRESMRELEQAEQVIFSLARAVEAKDKYTEGHCERLSELAVKLGRKLNLPEEDLKILNRGGILHDIGKISIADSILLKNGPLTPAEFEEIKTHPEIGERICSPLKTLHPVLPAIKYHQERWDGSGYPEGLKGKEIPLHARIIGIVDSFDALTTDRPYRKALSDTEAIEIIKDETKKGKWDPEIVSAFLDMEL
jgi:putative two-component system response regulator